MRLRPRQAELLYYARKKIGIGRGTVATTTAAGGPFYPKTTTKEQAAVLLCDEEN